MKQILILADGLAAKHFIDRINLKRVSANSYSIVSPNPEFELPEKKIANMTLHHFDPTSFSKLKKVFSTSRFDMVFILLDNAEDARESLNNIREIDEKIQIYLLDEWDNFGDIENSFVQIFNINQLIANRLFDHLPNVPLVAQNVGVVEGEIMEVSIPYESSFAYRHMGSISQVKWRIVAIYRDSKLILPTSATMIKPLDSLLIIGKPQILNNIYTQINGKQGIFPEPFGRDLYIILDMNYDADHALNYINEAMYMQERLTNKQLVVRIMNPGRFDILERIKSFDGEGIEVLVEYSTKSIDNIIMADMQKHNIGLIFSSGDTFINDDLSSVVRDMKKLIYIFGQTPLSLVERSVILMDDDEGMETISSTSFYISQTLGLDLHLCNYDPEGDFESKKMIVEHYETLSNVTHYPVSIEEKKINPIRSLENMKNILQIAPLTYDVDHRSWFSIFSTKLKDHLFDSTQHPKLLIPVIVEQ